MIFTILCIGVDVQFTLVKSKEGVMYLIQQRLYWLFEIAPLWFSFQLQYIGVSQPPLVTGWKIPRISSPSGAPPLGGHNPPFNAQSRERAKEPLCWCHCCTACYGTPSMPRMIKKSISASQLFIFCTRTPLYCAATSWTFAASDQSGPDCWQCGLTEQEGSRNCHLSFGTLSSLLDHTRARVLWYFGINIIYQLGKA